MSRQRPGQTLFEFVRYFSHHTPETGAVQGRLVVVVEAVHALIRRGVPPTINAVAREVGIDQSGASRWITSATERGYLELHDSASDGRSRLATVAPAGHELLADAHAWQQQTFELLTAGWSTERRREFEQAMSDLIDRSRELNGHSGR